jgi:hypothetical protein
MFRRPSLVLTALLLMGSVTAFAGEAGPSKQGEPALPEGSPAATPPTTPPAGTAADKVPDAATSKSGENPDATSPGEENKGMPIVPEK